MYLKNTAFLPDELARIINAGDAGDNGGILLSLSRDTSEQFRSIFTERLAKVGFDGGYEPTSEGNVLETLIDRFYFK